jgi:hypothetical protein
MMNTQAADNRTEAKASGIILIASSLLAMLMIAHHPQATTHAAGQLMAEIADKAAIDRLVHGSLMVLLAIQAWCYSGFCMRLGIAHGMVRAGATAYAMGIVAIFTAATIDGFVVADVGTRYVAGRPEELEAARHLLNLCGISVGEFTSVAVVAMSTAFIRWSLALLRAPRVNAWLGVTGLMLGAGPALGLVLGAITMNLHGAIVFLLCQTIWNVAVGITLLRGKL